MPLSAELCRVPAALPPEGVQSNLENPTSLGPVMMAVMSILTAWATIFTTGRIYVNIRKLRWSDYFVLAALVILIGFLGYKATLLKTARHIWDVPACFFDAEYAMGTYFTAILFNLGQFFAKASIFLLFGQIFTVSKSMNYAIWIGQAFNFLIYWTGVGIATYYQVPHAGETWVDTLDGRALIPIKWWQAMSGLIVALDIYILVLPLPTLFALKVALRQKIQLIAIFSLGIMGIASSIASLVERILILKSNDQTWIAAVLTLCSAVELSIAIIVSSAPGFAAFTRRHPLSLSSIVGFLTGRSKATSKLGLVGSSKATSNAADIRDSASYRNREYYELDDSWLLKTGGTADVERVDTALADAMTASDGAIMRTVAVEPKVGRAS